MSDNILKQIVKQLLVSPFKLFSLQLDESTDISSCSQLMVFVRYVHDYKFKEEFLFCHELETTTRAQDVFDLIDNFSKLINSNGRICVAFVVMEHQLCLARVQAFKSWSKTNHQKSQEYTA